MDGTCATEDFPEPSPNIAPAPPCTLAEHGRALLSRRAGQGAADEAPYCCTLLRGSY